MFDKPLVASAECYSEHPLARAVRDAARERHIDLVKPEAFEALPGRGMRARVSGSQVEVGSQRIFAGQRTTAAGDALIAQGKTLLYIRIDDKVVGILAAADTLRPEAPQALAALKELGVRHIELQTGDNECTAAAVAGQLGIGYRVNLLPEDKIRIVKAYQEQGRIVAMVGDGVNDAPALAQAHVGIAMGVSGTDVAIEAAHIALMKDDWMQLPRVFKIARHTMSVVKMNFGFTIAYNIIGLTLATVGILPPILAAATQSLPDMGILGNSSRLLRQK